MLGKRTKLVLFQAFDDWGKCSDVREKFNTKKFVLIVLLQLFDDEQLKERNMVGRKIARLDCKLHPDKLEIQYLTKILRRFVHNCLNNRADRGTGTRRRDPRPHFTSSIALALAASEAMGRFQTGHSRCAAKRHRTSRTTASLSLTPDAAVFARLTPMPSLSRELTFGSATRVFFGSGSESMEQSFRYTATAWSTLNSGSSNDF